MEGSGRDPSLYTSAAAVDEARVMACAYGMDLDTLMQVIGHGTRQCFVADKWDYVATDWSHLRPLGKKDVGHFVEVTKAKGLDLQVIETMFSQDWRIKSDERAG